MSHGRPLLTAAVVLLLLGATLAYGAAPVSNKDAVAKLARSSNAFGFDLYQRLLRFGALLVDPHESFVEDLSEGKAVGTPGRVCDLPEVSLATIRVSDPRRR